MKKTKSIILIASIVVVLIAGLSVATYFILKPMFGNEGKIGQSGDGTQLTDKQANKVVAEVNDEKIIYKDFYSMYSQQAAYYGITDETSQSAEMQETLKNMKSEILNQLIQQEIAAQKTKEAGYEVTDEKIDEATKTFEEMIQSIAEQMKAMDTSGEEGKNYIKDAEEYINSELEAMGLSKDEYLKEYAEYSLVTQYMEDLTKDITVSDDEIKTYYDEQLNVQKENPEEVSYAAVQLIEPSNSKVKHVLISLPKAEQDEYSKMVREGKQEEADAYLNEKLAAIKPKAEEVLNKAKSGEDFEALIKEFGEDEGMESEQYKDGYVVTENSQFIPSFEEASLALGEGEISELVAGPYGYHIIKVYEKNAEKAFPLEEKNAEIKTVLESEKKTAFMDEKMKEWEEASKIVKYEDLL